MIFSSESCNVRAPLQTSRSLATPSSLKMISVNPIENQYTALTVLQLRIASLIGIRTSALNHESWVWSHASRHNESIILSLSAAIEESGGSDTANPALVGYRSALLEMLLRFDYPSYIRACTTLGGLIPRRELPNVQDVPLPASMQLNRKTPQRVDPILLGKLDSAKIAEASTELIPDCALPNVTFSESLLDQALLWVFRALVQKETGFSSSKTGILGLLEEGREYMLRPNQVWPLHSPHNTAAPSTQTCSLTHPRFLR